VVARKNHQPQTKANFRLGDFEFLTAWAVFLFEVLISDQICIPAAFPIAQNRVVHFFMARASDR
jgi:hypothetical protein